MPQRSKGRAVRADGGGNYQVFEPGTDREVGEVIKCRSENIELINEILTPPSVLTSIENDDILLHSRLIEFINMATHLMN